ncbi:hypothetical protein K456DRAFT_1764218 [Colletotrichum gloeosporioides 23]|nr:hypothetical protein K456DRAFT_1764218 [Colletotrichum gloeosporioides 23]
MNQLCRRTLNHQNSSHHWPADRATQRNGGSPENLMWCSQMLDKTGQRCLAEINSQRSAAPSDYTIARVWIFRAAVADCETLLCHQVTSRLPTFSTLEFAQLFFQVGRGPNPNWAYQLSGQVVVQVRRADDVQDGDAVSVMHESRPHPDRHPHWAFRSPVTLNFAPTLPILTWTNHNQKRLFFVASRQQLQMMGLVAEKPETTGSRRSVTEPETHAL